MDAFTDTLERLKRHRGEAAPRDIRAAFATDPHRFDRFSVRFGAMLLDWSKCAVDNEAMRLLLRLGEAARLEEARAAMLSGERVNRTENRAALHTALRNRSGEPVFVDGRDVMPTVRATRAATGAFAEGVRTGTVRGATGRAFADVVNIGIGGSDLGPAMAVEALKAWHDGPRCRFVSNVDPAHVTDALAGLNPETALFIVASKTFATAETMANAATARAWLTARLGEDAAAAHFAAVTAAPGKPAAFGIVPDRVFPMADFVGGRTSVWSAVGLPLTIAIGPARFDEFLDGARVLDRHFAGAPPERNLPVLLGLVGFWHRVVCGYPARAVIPYAERFARLPAFLQQLDMESNGKGVREDGTRTATPTGPLVWGATGTNSQHAFFQALHQGSDAVPVEFIAIAEAEREAGIDGAAHGLAGQHDLLLANCLAQSRALMRGRTLDEALAGGDPALGPHRVCPGNRPSVTILLERLTPHALGQLLALFEHRAFVEAQLYGVNAFDQWGVELGKELAAALLPVVEGRMRPADLDGSTAGLAAFILEARKA